jgi:carboxyl-terminal processing protease
VEWRTLDVDRRYLYVRVKAFQEQTDLGVARALESGRAALRGELRGLVLDLRNNPGGLLEQAVAVSDRFLPGNLTIVTTRGRGARSTDEAKSRDRDTEKPYPVVVLVNGGSASAAEIVAGALQDHGRALIVGTPTFGKGSVQTVIELEDGSGLKLTIARYFTPKHRSIQGKGITPDVVVGENPPAVAEETGKLHERDLEHALKPDGTVVAEATTVDDYQLRTALDTLRTWQLFKAQGPGVPDSARRASTP